jgi:hypothetical protein
MALYMYLCNSFQIQSILWAVLAAVGIFLYTCDIQVQPDLTNPVYYLYFIYFFSKYMTNIFSLRAHPLLNLRVFQTGATK